MFLPNDIIIRKAKKKTRNLFLGLFIFFILFGICFIILYPLLYMLSISVRPANQMFDPTVVWIPKTYTLKNITAVFNIIEYPKAFFRTISITLLNTIIQCVTCSLVGYGFARFKFKGREILFLFVLFTLIVPPQAITIPLYSSYVNFNFFGLGEIGRLITGKPFTVSLIDTVWPGVISAMFSQGIRAGLFIYIFRQYFRNMPKELEEASYIDGYGPLKTYLKIMIPNAGPVILVTFLFSLVWYWNDYFYSSLFFNQSKPLSVLVGNFSYFLSTYRNEAQQALNLGETLAYLQIACLLYILPILILYIALQRYFTESIVKAGIVG